MEEENDDEEEVEAPPMKSCQSGGPLPPTPTRRRTRRMCTGTLCLDSQGLTDEVLPVRRTATPDAHQKEDETNVYRYTMFGQSGPHR